MAKIVTELCAWTKKSFNVTNLKFDTDLVLHL